MPTTMTAGPSTNSTPTASPVKYPHHGPRAARTNAYGPPAYGIIVDISEMEYVMPTYMAATMTVAIAKPPKPPSASPKFHPKKSPEITAPTPSANRDQKPA